MEAFLYQGNNKPEDHHISGVEAAKLNSYLSILKNYRTAILEARNDYEWEHEIDKPLYARAEYLKFNSNKEPSNLELKSDITIDSLQYRYTADYDTYTREDFLQDEDYAVHGAVIKNESEVNYYYGATAAGDFSYKEEIDLNEEMDNLVDKYIGDEVLSFIIEQGESPFTTFLKTSYDYYVEKTN